jgi:hypothetical protein
MLVEFTLAINGNRVYVNPANVNCVYGDKDSSVGTYIEMAGYSEDHALGVLGTPAEVAAELNGEAK